MTQLTDDKQRFESLLKPLAGQAYRVALGLTRHPEAAVDLVQDATILAFRSFHTFELGTNFRAWFLRILTNKFLKDRTKKAHPVVGLDDIEDVFLYKKATELGLLGNQTDPMSLLMNSFDLETIQDAIVSLPEDYRSTAVLYFLDDMSYEEIAHILEIPVGTVRSRLHRGRKALQQSLWQLAKDKGIFGEAKTHE